MKRKAKSRGSGGRLRLTLLLATAAALLLVPAASASAAEVHIIIEGTGAGTVKGIPPLDGTPPINCSYVSPGPQTGVCNAAMNTSEGIEGEKVEEIAAPGSEFAGWTSEGGLPLGCEPQPSLAPECGVLSFGGPVTIKAKFKEIPKPEFNLNLSISGSGSGSFKCDTGGGPGPCAAKYKEGKVVTVTPDPAASSDFVNWTGDCSGSGSCVVTFTTAEHSVGAVFNTKSLAFTATKTGAGTGTIVCKDNGSPVSCSGSFLYGHTIKVEATPDAENELASLTGTGSASGNCSVGTKTCEFEIKVASSVTAQFELESRKDQKEVNTVHGDVVQDTILESNCSSVDLTPGSSSFLPGVPADYYHSCGLTLTSTGTATTLTASDGSAINTGHLVQAGPPLYFLPSLLETRAIDSEGGTSTGVKTLETPAVLLEFGKPISKDATTLEFNQHIGEHDGLHHGVYAKLITLTLYQTTP